MNKRALLLTYACPPLQSSESFLSIKALAKIDNFEIDIENFIDDYLGEVSNIQISNTADVPDGSFIPKGKKRKLNTAKSEDWYTSGGYTQTDFPKADAIFGDDDAEERIITYTIKNLPDETVVRGDFDQKSRPFIFFLRH